MGMLLNSQCLFGKVSEARRRSKRCPFGQDWRNCVRASFCFSRLTFLSVWSFNGKSFRQFNYLETIREGDQRARTKVLEHARNLLQSSLSFLRQRPTLFPILHSTLVPIMGCYAAQSDVAVQQNLAKFFFTLTFRNNATRLKNYAAYCWTKFIE